jgi:hypothetical protein
MALVPAHNDTKAPRYMGGKLVPPGETRMVEETYLGPPATAEPTPEPVDSLLALLDLSVPNFTNSMVELVASGEVNQADIARLMTAENNGNTRKGAIAVLEEAALQLAAREERLTDLLKALETADSASDYDAAIEGEDDEVIINTLTAVRDGAFPDGVPDE